jgi:hypothetical protein
MKTRNLLLIALGYLYCSTSVAQTLPVSFDAQTWKDTYLESGIDVYQEDGNLVFELSTTADPAWQSSAIDFIDLDLDRYPNLYVNTLGDEGAFWNMKITNPELVDQWSLISESSAGGNDVNTFGERRFEGSISRIFEAANQTGTGEKTFRFFVWVIGAGQRLVIKDLYFYGNVSSTKSPILRPSFITSRQGGIIINNAENKQVTIFTTDGKLFKQINVTDKVLNIDLVKGLYLVKVGKSTIKTLVL